MKQLTKPMKGWIFTIKCIVFNFNVAKTMVWGDDIEDTKWHNINSKEKYSWCEVIQTKREYYFLNYSVINRPGTDKAYQLIVGPFKVIIGIPETWSWRIAK